MKMKIIAAIILIAGGVIYVWNHKKAEAPTVTVRHEVQSPTRATTTPVSGKLTDAQFIAVVDAPENAKVMAKGDINGDGYEDAIVQEMTCGASCSFNLDVVFNEQNKSARLFIPDGNANFEPAYVGSSAVKSEVTNITIQNGIISLTGKGLMCGNFQTGEICSQEEWNKTKTITYKFDGKNIVQIDSQEKK